MRAVGREFYDVRLETEILEVAEEDLDGASHAHVTFRVTEAGPCEDVEDISFSRTRRSSASSFALLKPVVPQKPIIDVSCFCEIFPFHIVVDRSMVIRQCGLKLQKMVGLDRCVGDNINEHFTILHPPVSFDFDKINEFINASYVIKVNIINRISDSDIPKSASTIILKGM